MANCQDHLQIATQGIYPGFSTFQAALQGFGCSVEIIIPQYPDGGGGWGYEPVTPGLQPIIIKVTRNGKVWEKEIMVSRSKARGLASVITQFKGVRKSITEVFVKLNNIISEATESVRAFTKRNKK